VGWVAKFSEARESRKMRQQQRAQTMLGLLTVPYMATAVYITVHVQLPSILSPVPYAYISVPLMVRYGVQDSHKMVIRVDTVK
jgi:hypothetical protein